MNLLFDYISCQGFYNGGAVYAERILNRLELNSSVNIILLYNSELEILSYGGDVFNKYKTIDLKNKSIFDIIREYQIDVFLILIAQRYSKLNFKNITCRCVVVIHDLVTLEYYGNRFHYLLSRDTREKFKFLIDMFFFNSYYHRIMKSYSFLKMIHENKKVHLCTVSNHTKHNILFYFPYFSEDEISVFYNPLDVDDNIREETSLNVPKDKKIILFFNANRVNKNAELVFAVMKRFLSENDSYIFVTTGIDKRIHRRHYGFLSISENDKKWLLSKCEVLIYASVAEGYGLPPIEALLYKKKVICSNIAPMRDILKNSVMYFSPFYENDLYRCLNLSKTFVPDYQLMDSLSEELIAKGDDDTFRFIQFILTGNYGGSSTFSQNS